MPLVSLEAILDAPGEVALLPADAALPHLPAATLKEGEVLRFLQGQAAGAAPGLPGALARVYGREWPIPRYRRATTRPAISSLSGYSII